MALFLEHLVGRRDRGQGLDMLPAAVMTGHGAGAAPGRLLDYGNRRGCGAGK